MQKLFSLFLNIMILGSILLLGLKVETLLFRVDIESLGLMSVLERFDGSGVILSWDTTLLLSLGQRLGKSLRVVFLSLQTRESLSTHIVASLPVRVVAIIIEGHVLWRVVIIIVLGGVLNIVS